MAEWKGTILTTAGRQLLAKATAGQPLSYTRVALGDGALAADQDAYNFTNLINEKLNLPARGAEVVGDGTSKIEVILSNSTLSQGFFSREIGVFAMDGDTEILYAYDNCGEKCDYIPAWGRINPVNLVLDIYTVIDQTDKVTIIIKNDLLFITKAEFLSHINSNNPHENWLKIGSKIDNCINVFINQGSGKQLDWMDIDSFRKIILGGEASTIPSIKNRVTQLEREQANISLALTAQQIYPDYNMLLSEDFVVPDKIDTFVCTVKSAVAGDNGIDVETLAGIVPGAWYTISDGVNSEYFQVKSCIKNGSVFRILANTNLANTYKIEETLILRSTAEIGIGVVYGSGDKKGFNWSPSLTWAGVNANVASTIKLETTQEKADEFDIDGEIAFTSGGLVTLGGE